MHIGVSAKRLYALFFIYIILHIGVCQNAYVHVYSKIMHIGVSGKRLYALF